MKNGISRAANTLLRLVFPPRCAVCGEVLPFTRHSEVCESCSAELDAEKRTVCNICGKEIGECVCSSLADGQIPVSMMFYTKDSSRAAEKMVFHLKDDKSSEAHRYFARELSRLILKSLAAEGSSADGWLVTYAPRSEEKLTEAGFDQGKRLAEATAEYTGMTFVSVFLRSGSAVQKELSAAERAENAKTMRLSDDADVIGKRIFVIDDIITTGATMNAAVGLLTEAGAVEVKAASVFRGMPKKIKRTEPKGGGALWFEQD